MKKTAVLFSIALLLCWAAPTRTQVPPTDGISLTIAGGNLQVIKVDEVVIVKKDLTVVSSFPFTITAPAGSALYFWQSPAGVTATDYGDKLEVSAAPNGMVKFTVKAISAKLDKDGKFLGFDTRFGSISFSIGAPKPPEPPKPPDPPTPPSPVPVSALTVAVVYETAELKATDAVVITSQLVRKYLGDKAKGGYRFLDKDTDVSNEPKVWKDIMARPHSPIPWIGIYTPTAAYEGPLPAGVDATLALLAKFGG